MAEKSIRISESESGDYLAFRDAFELGGDAESRVIQRLDIGGGKFLTPIDAVRRGPFTHLTAADSFDLTALPSELICNKILIGEGRVLRVAVDQYVTAGTVTLTPILFDNAKPPNIVGVLQPVTFLQPFTHRRSASTGGFFPLQIASWDVLGAHYVGLHCSAITGTSNAAKVWCWVDGCSRTYADRYFRSVSLLLPMNGANNSVAFLDYSPNNFTVTPSGDAKISTAQYKFDGSSGYFDGNGDYLSIPASESLVLAAGDFTIEGWFRPASTTGDHVVIYRGAANVASGNDMQFSVYTSGTSLIIRPYVSTTDHSIIAGTVATGNWYHFAMVRKADTVMAFLNGVKSGTTKTITTLLNNNAGWLTYIGDMNIGGTHAYFNGYLQDIRITKGVARYVDNFTPPESAGSRIEISGDDEHYRRTSLLLHGHGANNSTTILDSSWSPKVITVGGDAKISTDKYKFGLSSIYFDGNNDYLTLPNNADLNNFGTGDFTIEGWFYTLSDSNKVIISCGTSWSGAHGYDWHLLTDGTINFRAGNNIPISITSGAGVYTKYAWHHLAVTRASGVTQLFYNGNAVGSPHSGTVTISNSSSPRVGQWYANTSSTWYGYMAEFRITKGFARYKTGFSVPTEMFPSNRER